MIRSLEPGRRERANNDGHVEWPADRFYWALLDASSVSRGARRPRTEQLGYLLEGKLPGLAIEDVHAVYSAMPNAGRQQYLACAAEHRVLKEEVN